MVDDVLKAEDMNNDGKVNFFEFKSARERRKMDKLENL